MFLEGEWNRRVGIPPPRLGTMTFLGGALCSAGLSRFSPATPGGGVSGTSRIPGSALDTCGSGIPFRGWDSARGHLPPPLGGSGRVACCRGRRRHWRVWWGRSWDLEAEGHRQGEDTDLVAPAELWPNGNRTRHVSTPYRPPGLPICSWSTRSNCVSM